MPTPLAHSAVAVAAARLANGPRPARRTLAAFVLLANLPDVDLVPGFWVGSPLQFHHALTHSLFFAAASALLFSAVRWGRGAGDDRRSYAFRLLCLLGVGLSHPFLDLFTVDKPGIAHGMDPGMALWWPFLSARVGPIYGFFNGTVLTMDWRDWLVANNLQEFAFESAFGLGILAAAWLWTREAAAAAPPPARARAGEPVEAGEA